jgi:hypothetical protein
MLILEKVMVEQTKDTRANSQEDLEITLNLVQASMDISREFLQFMMNMRLATPPMESSFSA